MKRLALFAASCVLGAACKTAEPTPEPSRVAAPAVAATAAPAAQSAATAAPAAQSTPAAAAVPPGERPMPPGLDAAVMDPSANPCEDFYAYACGGWLKTTEIPAERARWSRGFETVAERNQKVLRDILTRAAEGQGGGTPEEKLLGDYYGACMDEAKLEEALPVLRTYLTKLTALKSPQDVAKAVAWLHARDVDALFKVYSDQDQKDSTQVIPVVSTGGMGLPDRDYYLKPDVKMREARAAYQAHVQKVFELLGDAPFVASRKATGILAIETRLATAALPKEETREPEKVYHRLERQGLKQLAPAFQWDTYFAEVGLPAGEALNVTQPKFFAEVSALVRQQRPSDMGPYLSYHFVREVQTTLPKAVRDEFFRFDSAVLTGAKVDLARWKKCVEVTDEALPHALAKPFIASTFGEEGKATTLAMVQQIEQSFERNLDTLSWMDADTKAQALVKVRKITNKIGYPDQWRRYDGLALKRDSFLDSYLAADAFEQARQLRKVGKPVDPAEWLMSPPTVNAYYNAATNEIVFPAGILQPPFFGRDAAAPVNFGAMGMVVGHEITHGFDDEGRQFDAVGNLRTWWTPASDKAFRERVACVRQQYDGYTAVDEVKVNGRLTLGENVADLGGLKLAYAAMEAYLAKHPDQAAQANAYRFTPGQQFFLAHAQSWCSKIRNEAARQRALTDSHAPAFLRVNGPVTNLPQFQQAFSCQQGTKMVAPTANRCEVW
ncbi:M13 family metallopeptidase [Corallococcus sp. CA053C]|uniref:M13 family metallopeptidase n=1 Tax=Corallococcus sp. CA053C TaxID=2316732 RepID=UPI001F2EE0EB|nr:M13 family metallopeptidase [Corallococcus sp. CA053C]